MLDLLWRVEAALRNYSAYIVQLILRALPRPLTAPAATSKSSTRGQVKIPHLTAAGRGDDYALSARLATFSAASLRR